MKKRSFVLIMVMVAAVCVQSGNPLTAGARGSTQINSVKSLKVRAGDVLNVMASPYNAQNDGSTDDISPIQQAIYDGEGAAPPNFPRTNGSTVYLPESSACYAISKPLRVASGPIEIKGDRGSCIRKSYAGPTIISEAWGTNHLKYGKALVGKGASISTVGCTAGRCGNGFIDLAQFLDTTQLNLAAVFAEYKGFDIEFWMEPTNARGGNVLGSNPNNPGIGNGMFYIAQNASSMAIFANVNTTGGLIRLSVCRAQTPFVKYDVALDWDRTTYRLFQGGTLCSSVRSSNAPVLGPFESMLIPDLGGFDYWMAGGNISDPFQGYLDEIRFEFRSLHTLNYAPSTNRFVADGYTALLIDPSVENVDGTQLATTGYAGIESVYLPVLAGASGGMNGLHLHNLELCAPAIKHNASDGYFAQWSVNTEVDHISCANAVYAGLNFYNNDYGNYEHDNIVDGGMLGILHGVAWNGSLAENDYMDVQAIACEETIGDGGGGFHDTHEGCVNRGGLHYCKMYMGEAFSSLVDFDGCDQEAGDTNFVASILDSNSSIPIQFNSPDLSGVSGRPFIEVDGYSAGPTIINGQFQQGVGATDIVNYGSTPTSPTILVNPKLPKDVPLSNQTGDPWVQTVSNGTVSHPFLSLGIKTANFSVSWTNQDTVSAVLGAGSLMITLTNPTKNSIDYLQICQDTLGSHMKTTFAAGTHVGTLRWSNGSPPILTTGANKCDRLKFAFDGVNLVGALDIGNF
jgi:hypothetical protein